MVMVFYFCLRNADLLSLLVYITYPPVGERLLKRRVQWIHSPSYFLLISTGSKPANSYWLWLDRHSHRLSSRQACRQTWDLNRQLSALATIVEEKVFHHHRIIYLEWQIYLVKYWLPCKLQGTECVQWSNGNCVEQNKHINYVIEHNSLDLCWERICKSITQ